MKICICDDNKTVHKEIENHIADFFTEESMPDIFHFDCGEELVDCYARGDFFDIIFLDIEMGRLNGLDTAGEIRKHSPDAIIIFVSSHRHYVFDSFKYEALHYIVKPINKNEFSEIFTRALHKYRMAVSFFPIRWNQTRNNIRIDDILYIESYKRRLIVHTRQGEKLDHIGKISDAHTQLQPHGFIFVHQGYLVNMHYIKAFHSEEVVLQGGEKVQISVRKRLDALRAYDKYLQKWKW